MTTDSPQSDPPNEPLTLHQATKLMKLGMIGPRRPADELIDCLARDRHGVAWLEKILEDGPLRDLGNARPLLADGDATVEQLIEIKNRSKRLLKEASSVEERLGGVAGYFLSIAAGLRHHHARIGGKGRLELDQVMLDLAEFAPEPYSSLLCGATVVEVRDSDGGAG